MSTAQQLIRGVPRLGVVGRLHAPGSHAVRTVAQQRRTIENRSPWRTPNLLFLAVDLNAGEAGSDVVHKVENLVEPGNEEETPDIGADPTKNEPAPGAD